ncbi:MAG: flagellar export chaperone FliS [Deltaproteobacteria bacterium]|nr:flagellar export chaperone FliS [Deltaproteobacteria bacterium]
MVEKGMGTYQEISFLTADPKKLILICYSQAILNLKTAREHYVAKEYEAKAKSLQKALDIICELNNALDFKKGGSIAKNLDELYKYMTRSLLEADIKKDINMFAIIIRMLEELESAWKAIIMPSDRSEARPQMMVEMPARIGAPPVATARMWSA